MADKKAIKSLDQLLQENKELRDRLSRSEEALHALLNDADTFMGTEHSLVYETMSDGFVLHTLIYDQNGDPSDYCLNYVNPAFEKITGLSKKEILGKRASEAYLVEKAPYLKIYADVALTGQPVSFETYFPPMDKHFRISVFSPGKERFATVFQDITEQIHLEKKHRIAENENRKFENALNESEKKFSTVFNAAPVAMSLATNPDGKILEVNQEWLKLMKFERKEEIIGKTSVELGLMIDNESRSRILSEFQKHGIIKNVEISGFNSEGEAINLLINVHPVQIGGIKYYLSTNSDITLRKRMEQELLESREIYKELVSNAKTIILKFNNDARFTFINDYALEFFGYKLNELLGESVMMVVPKTESTGRNLDEMVENITNDPDKYSVNINENIKKNGEKVWVEWHNKTLFDKAGKKTGHIAIGTDITKRRIAELRLMQSEDRLRTIAESLTVMISITRKHDSITLFANDPFLKAYGFTATDLIGKKTPDIFVFPEDKSTIHDILAETEFVKDREAKVKRIDGTQFWIITSIRKITYMGDISFLASSIDITETKRTQEELVRLNRTLDAHSKSSQAMLNSKDEFSYLNEVCKIIIEDCGHAMVWVGYAQNDIRKSVLPVAYHGFDKGYIDQMNVTWDDSAFGRGPTGTAIRTCRPSICKNMLTDPRFEPWRDAAIARGYSSSLVLPLITEGRCFGAVSIYSKEPDSFSDTEIDLLNDLVDDLAHGISYIRLAESERTAARAIKENEAKLKELIVTKDKFFNIVAHDLKNPFTSLLGASELLYDNINQMTTENVKKLALILNDSAKGGYAILQNLLDWSRSQTGLLKFSPEKVNLRSIIDENIDNLNLQTSNKGISLKSGLKTDLFLMADKNMINTVLRNLLSNAVKFTYKNGKISISVIVHADEVILTVCDTGIGMPKDKIEMLSILENALSMPGTEKEKGTGLGLKLCKEFTEIMGGRIWAESEPGKGSKFSFSIPVKID